MKLTPSRALPCPAEAAGAKAEANPAIALLLHALPTPGLDRSSYRSSLANETWAIINLKGIHPVIING